MTRLSLLLFIATSAFAQPFQLQPGAPLRVQGGGSVPSGAIYGIGYGPMRRCSTFPNSSTGTALAMKNVGFGALTGQQTPMAIDGGVCLTTK